MKLDEIRALLERYQQGTCTEEEQKALEEWYGSLQLGEETPLSNSELDQSLERVRMNLPGMEEVDEAVPVIHPGAGNRNKRLLAAAASLALLMLALGWLFFSRREKEFASLTRVANPGNDTLIVTGRGETHQLILPDGSSVQLNASSAFRYPKHFSAHDRTVTLLKGEAFLQVITDPERPFSVLTGSLQTRVLGTSFDIRSYEEEKKTQVALLAGKVQILARDRSLSVVLSPRQLLRVDQVTGKADTAFFDSEYEVAAWKEGGLNFRDADFDQLAFEIGNKFNVRLINNSSKRQWSYTGLFRNEGLQEVLETICQTEHLSYIFRDNEILIVNK